MSGRSLIDQIRHYQRDIERCPENKERMIRCIQRLYVLPILVQHLQETGVGRSVNSLRKYEGEVGNAAKALVAKWKAMVAAEEAAELEQMERREEQEKPPDSPPPSVEVKGSENGRHKSDKSNSSSSRHNKRRDEERSSHKKSSHREHHTGSDSRSHKSRRRNSDESDSSPSRKKRKKHCVREKRRHRDEDESESESEVEQQESEKQSSAEEEEAEEVVETAERSSDDDREASEAENDSDSTDSSSDHRHRSKKSSDPSRDKSSSSNSRHKPSSSSRNKRATDSGDSEDDKQTMKDLIKENERKVKKERHESYIASSNAGESLLPSQKSESSPSKSKVKVKLEKHEDGIDGTSGFSFADALLGAESSPKKKKKSKSEPSKSSKSENRDGGSPSSSRKDKTSSSKSHSSSSKSHHSSSSKHSSSSSKTHHSSSSSSKTHHSSSSSSKHRSSSSSNNHSSSSRKSDDSVPDLLKNPVKMEALDFDINSTLPEITPNYRPLPHVPDRKPPKPSVSDEDHMFHLMTTKNQRTKVYSGAKYGSCSSVPSLYALCIQLLYENIDAVEYTGGVPYDILKPLLQKLNSDQLYVIEHFNPYLIEDTDSLWEFHCKKDFRSEKRQDMESWRDLYLRCMDEREKKLKALTANINESIAKSTPVRTAKLAYVDSMAKPPRNIARKQAKYGTGSGSSSTATTASLGANTAQKQEILSKAMVGANTPGIEPVSVPAPPNPRSQASFSSATVKKKKAPLMAKALQLIKGNRFKR